MKVSILVITYNHEKYIAQALDSILIQDVNFDYEIIVGEDCSQDRTGDIVLEYANKYPELVKPLLNQVNRGMISNFLSCYEACSGKYIAMLEGDDYWLDKDKLKKQIEILDSRPDLVACFHNVSLLDMSSGNITTLPEKHRRDIYTLEDFIKLNRVYTPSLVFRNGLIKEFPEWFKTLGLGDWPIHLLLTRFGNYKYLPELMAVYRLHDKGVWSGQPLESRTIKAIEMLRCVDQYYERKYTRQIKSSITRQLFILAEDLSRTDRRSALKYIGQALIANPGIVLRRRFWSFVINTLLFIRKPCQKN